MKNRKQAKQELIEEISTEGLSLDLMDAQINVRVNSHMLKILRDFKVPVSYCVRKALTDIAEQLIESQGDFRQPDFHVYEVHRKHE